MPACKYKETSMHTLFIRNADHQEMLFYPIVYFGKLSFLVHKEVCLSCKRLNSQATGCYPISLFHVE